MVFSDGATITCHAGWFPVVAKDERAGTGAATAGVGRNGRFRRGMKDLFVGGVSAAVEQIARADAGDVERCLNDSQIVPGK